MAHVTFYYDGVENATITASSGGSTLNLKDRNPNHKWTSGGTTNGQTLTFEFAEARTADSCVVDGTNWANLMATSVELFYWDDELETPAYVWHSEFALLNTKQVITFSEITTGKWQIIFYKASGDLATAPQLGNIIIGSKIEMTNHPYNASYLYGKEYNTNTSRTYNGTLYSSQAHLGITKWNLKWSNIDDTLRTKLLNLHSGVRGGLYPFYFLDADNTLSLVTMNNDEFSLEKKGYNLSDSIDLKLESAGVS